MRIKLINKFKHKKLYAYSDGRIYNAKTGNFRKPVYNKCVGYNMIGIRGGDPTKPLKNDNYLWHRIIAETFVHNPDNKPQVNHIDGDKFNNSADNLEWVTNEENMAHAIKNGLFDHIRGENSPKAKQSDELALKAMRYALKKSPFEASKKYNIPTLSISRWLSGERRSYLREYL